jgi:pilus assembly protein FimV
MRSRLNEPLLAEVALIDLGNLGADDIRVRLASAEDFARVGVERAYFLTSMSFDVQVNADGNGKVVLATKQALLEPYLDFILEVRWPEGRLLREYTVLVDIPSADSVQMVASPTRPTLESDTQIPAPTRSDREPLSSANNEADSEVVPAAVNPERAYTEGVQALPNPGERYLVQQADILWNVASRARPRNATVEQTMLAILAMNPSAFVRNNINGLKAGYVLYLPTEQDIKGTSADAVLAVAQQHYEWREGVTSTPSVRVVADVEPTRDTEVNELGESSSAVPSAEASAARVDTEARVAAADIASDAAVQASPEQDAVPATTPVMTVENQQLAQLQSQFAALSDQLMQLRSLIEEKDQKILALQDELQKNTLAQAGGTRIDVQTVTDEVSPAPAPAPGLIPDASASKGLPWWLYALGGVVVMGAITVVALWRRQAPQQGGQASAPERNRTQTAAPAGEVSAAVAAESVNESAQSDMADAQERQDLQDKMLAQIESERGYGRQLLNEYAEQRQPSALAEADIYLAYGRPQQALDILKASLDDSLESSPARLKMIEIYLAHDRLDEAKVLVNDLERLRDTASLRRGLELLKAYKAKAEPEPAEIGDLLEDTSAPTSADALAPLDYETVDMTESAPRVEPEPELGHGVEQISATAVSSSAEVDQVAIDDSDWSLEAELEAPSPAAEREPVTTQGALDEVVSDVDLSLDLSLGEPSLTDLAAQGAELNKPDTTPQRLPPELAAVLGTDIPPPLAEVDYHDDEDGLIYATEADPIDTKLDLARAYIDMGDEDGARPVLEEVIREGNLSQQAEASDLLSRL